jgi:predicted Zn-dependent peptidase
MRRAVLSLGVLLLAVAGTAAARGKIPKSYKDLKTPELGKLVVPKAERHQLSNGMVIYTLEDHELPLVGGRALIRTGSIFEPAAKIGLGEITGTVMRTGGTASMDGDALDEALESRAASIETSVGANSGTASFSCLAGDLDQVLGLFADVLRRPAFAQDKLDLAKVQARSAISRRNDDTFEVTAREFRKAIYGADSPWARQSEYATVDAITRDDLQAFHAMFYHPNNLILGVWGDFDSAELMQTLERVFGDWPRDDRPLPPKPPVPETTSRSVFQVDKTDVTQANIRIGHMGVRHDDPDVYALEVLSEILGNGFSSRLFRRVRSDEGLAYFVGASFVPAYDRPGLFAVYGGTKNQSVHRSLSLMLEEIERIRQEPVEQQELDNAKAGLLNSFVFNFDSKREIVSRQIQYAYYDYPADFLDRYQPGISAVEIDDIQRVAHEHIHPDQFVTLVVGKTDEFDQALDDFGTITELDITIPEPAATEEIPEADPASLARGAELAARAVEAMGGGAALSKINSIQFGFQGEMTTPMGPMEISGTRLLAYPNRLRMEMQLPMGKMVMATDGSSGWMEMMGQKQDLASAQLEELSAEIARDLPWLLQRLADGRLKAQALEPADGAQVVLVRDGKLTTKLYIDNESGRVVKMAYRGRSQQGGPAPAVELLSAFKTFEGILLPTHSKSLLNGENASDLTITDVHINPSPEDTLFGKQ